MASQRPVADKVGTMRITMGMGAHQPAVAEQMAAGPTIFDHLGSFARAKPLGAVSAAVLVLVFAVAVLAPVIAPYDPTAFSRGEELRPYSAGHWLGTDQFGRDTFSRTLFGARASLVISVGSLLLGALSGAVLGVMSGYYMGRFDMLLQRLMDALMSFPSLILAMAVVAVLGPSASNIIIAIGLTFVPRMARVTRSSALSLRERQFVDAARGMGASDLWIMMRHIVPNAVAPFLVLASSELGAAILAESSLSFLGLGTQEPNPSLGGMLSRASQQYFLRAPWMAVWPGVALSVTVFAFNVLGDALRDVLDPRLRRGTGH